MLANLVNSLFGKDTNSDAEAAPPPNANANTKARNKRKKNSKQHYNDRKKKARTAAAFEAGTVLHATDANFKAMVLKSPVPVVVDYWAPWCGPCKAMGPVLDDLAAEMGDGARVVKLNVDDNPRTSSRYQIRSIPTLMVFAGGEQQEVLVGVESKARLSRLLKQYA